METIEVIAETVELIASGYEWVCPDCKRLNNELAVTEYVNCAKCNAKFEVTDHCHSLDK